MHKDERHLEILLRTLEGAILGIVLVLLVMLCRKIFYQDILTGTLIVLLGLGSYLLVSHLIWSRAANGEPSKTTHISNSQEDSASTPMMKSERYSEMVELWLCGKNRKS